MPTNPHHTGKNQSGIAMLGIVLVIVIILIALVSAVSLGPQLQNIANERQTSKRANVIVDAMKQYYLARGELPEPSSVPVGDLNLEQKYRFDAWGQEWEYFRAVNGNDPDNDLPHITRLEYNGLQIAGVLISGGPDQVIQTNNPVWDPVGDGVWRLTKAADSDDIIIPLNVQGEAIQIAKNELEVLAGRGCPEPGDGISNNNPITVAFLDRTGLGISYQTDPWTGNYYWLDGSPPLVSGYWMSDGPSGQSISQRTICTGSGTPFVALDFSEISTISDLTSHPSVAGVGSDVSITPLLGIGSVLDLGGTYGGGTSTTSWVELNDVSDSNDICGYTLMGWFRTPGSVLPERRQYITSRRPSHGGSYNTWSVSINSRTDPCLSSSGFCTQVTPPGETIYGASDDGGGGVFPSNTFAASLDTAGRGNAVAPVSPLTPRGTPVLPSTDPTDYKSDDVRDPTFGYGQLGDTWHFFAVNLVPSSLNTQVHLGRCRFIDSSDPPNQVPGDYTATMYISENNDGYGDPSGPHRLFARQETYSRSDTQYGPIATYLSGAGSYRIFIGRLGANTGNWVNPFRGQIARFYIYTKNQLLTHEQIVEYYNNTCPVFSGDSNCRHTSP